ncbi:hypothetical protein Cst_c22980 [Thermoclostridium stercorarium subsp. stercorarium DSM 8532]|uniref:Uncharacterized protein n=3 Tax=Thermoclostridium stercorarium TaxID=1510 RepID=L7VUJ6_THES1|nr:hypothetical protein [Thermoclostridium stercorarium]AGC69258.1 hypothetical protein Cst_c22980 [Thermoclostridium stercorarium subsp. stercorarium DSM 8532]ANW99530.1 hypothetical protein CSTERTH_11060 [Thermoclostridium stercorarium subsp. thermolacticum DSM 2910]ANX02157.1 hypothetical protein CSTERLE_11545 [Thermoclostridium stercorarium subsp. leptospartum DSM 9219]UZQ85228.1 hypothetical protein ODU73_002343 [Thermoclostridium stercorarium]
MKRFVAIVTSLFIIFVFIALNYLLWDRESLVNLKESNQASIDALSRINMNLSEENSKLTRQIEEMRAQIEELNEKITELENANSEQQNVINEMNQFIVNLKSHINPEPIISEAYEWINSLSEKNFDKALPKFSALCTFWGNNWSPRMFANYIVHNVNYIRPVLDTDTSKPLIEIIPYQTPDFNVKAVIKVEVDLNEKGITEYLKDGLNIIELDFTYNDRLEQWIITSVTSESAENSESAEKGDGNSSTGT